MTVLENGRALLALGLLAACGDKADDTSAAGGGGTGGAVATSCDDGDVLLFTDTGGAVTDLSVEAAAGSAGAPASLVIDQDGVLDVCGGTWHVNLTVAGSELTVRGGSGGSEPVLSGGGAGPILDLTTQGAVLVVEDLTLTDAKACFGAAIRGADFATECDREAGPLGADVTVRRSHLHTNTFDIGGGVIGLVGGRVLVEDSLVANNEGHAVFAVMTDVRCAAAAGQDAGLHDNTKSGVWLSAPGDQAGWSVVSEGCDWGNNGQEDVRLGEEAYFNDFGEDATFSCDARVPSCE